MVWAQIASAGKDLEDFAKHAGRTTIQTEDVLLLARRNEGLEMLLKEYADEVKKQTAGAGTGASTNKTKAKGKAKAGGR